MSDTLLTDVAQALNTTPVQAIPVVAVARVLWDTLANEGMVDAWGGAQSERVLPFALAVLHAAANALPEETLGDSFDIAFLRLYGVGA